MLSCSNVKAKTYNEFVDSPYYSGFVRFGQHIVQLRAINPELFIDHVIREGIPLDKWCDDRVYVKYLCSLLVRESCETAIERSITEIGKWADADGADILSFFTTCPKNRILTMIENGRISPWMIYGCDSGVKFVSGLDEKELLRVTNFIDPDGWSTIFSKRQSELEWVTQALTEVGF